MTESVTGEALKAIKKDPSSENGRAKEGHSPLSRKKIRIRGKIGEGKDAGS